MILVVENKRATEGFIAFIKRRIPLYMASILDTKRLKVFNDYFQSDVFKDTYGDFKVEARQVILLGATNLIHTKYENATHITINPKITYLNTDIKLVDLCKLINYGGLSVDAYPIFTDTFKHFADNIKMYSNKHLIGIG